MIYISHRLEELFEISDTPQIDRDKGFRQGISGHSNIKIIAQREAKWLKEPATSTMQQ